MSYIKKKWVTYLFLVILTFSFIYFGRKFNFDWFALFFVLIIFIAVFVQLNHNAKGNLAQHDLTKYSLIWQEPHKIYAETKEEAKRHTQIFSVILIALVAILFVLILVMLPFLTMSQGELLHNIKDFSAKSTYAILIGIFVCFGIIVTAFFLHGNIYFLMKGRNYRPKMLVGIYQEGILAGYHFIRWEDMKSISAPLHMNVPSRYTIASKTIRIQTKDDNVFLVGINMQNYRGFFDSVIKAGKTDLFNKTA